MGVYKNKNCKKIIFFVLLPQNGGRDLFYSSVILFLILFVQIAIEIYLFRWAIFFLLNLNWLLRNFIDGKMRMEERIKKKELGKTPLWWK